MKKRIILFISFFLVSMVQAQITFEHSYTNPIGRRGDLYSFHKSDNTLFYYTFPTSSSIEVYNESHAFVQTIPIPVYGQILYISDRLFDNDNDVELVIKKARQVTSPDVYLTYDILIIDHLGNIIYTFADRYEAHLTKDSNGSVKLIVDSAGSCPNGCTYSYNYIYDVYGLSGTLGEQQEVYLDNKMIGFPIPTDDILTISNIGSLGENLRLEIYDNSAKKILEENIIVMGNDVSIDVSSLKTGEYICRFKEKTIKFLKK